jgi:aspartyl-tRNA(Asn)/glutamyl-tRNA(Gln) amidotransferase subunit C
VFKKELEVVAFLARIDIEEEEAKYLADIYTMANYVEILQEVDTIDLKPTTYVTELRNIWRDDIVKSCPREVVEQILDLAPAREKTFYKVKKVIDAE